MSAEGPGRGPVAWLSAETPSAEGGGGGRRQFHQIRVLQEGGRRVEVGALRGPESDASIRRVAAVTRFGPPRLAGLLRDRALSGMLDRVRPAAGVVAHVDTVPLALPDLRRRRVPVLVEFHNVLSRHRRDLGDPAGAARAGRLERSALAGAAMATVCSREEATALEAHRSGVPIRVAPHGIDPAEWPESWTAQERAPVVAFFGTLEYPPNRDGVAWLAGEVWPAIHRALPRAELWLLGPGRVPDGIAGAAGVRVLGRVEDLAPVLGRAAVVAVPALWGPGARVKFIESLASGAAVVSTSIGAEGYDATGGFVEADGAKAFASACLDLLSDPAAAAALGRAGRRIAFERYTWTRTTAPIVDWLESISR